MMMQYLDRSITGIQTCKLGPSNNWPSNPKIVAIKDSSKIPFAKNYTEAKLRITEAHSIYKSKSGTRCLNTSLSAANLKHTKILLH